MTSCTNAVDYCELKFPSTLVAAEEGDHTEVYAHLYEAGITDQTEGVDEDALVLAEIGLGPVGEDPQSGDNWVWVTSDGNPTYGPASPDMLRTTTNILQPWWRCFQESTSMRLASL